MASRISIVRAQHAPHFVVQSEDQEIGRFSSLEAACEKARAAGAEISEGERRWLEHWLSGGRGGICEPGPTWRKEGVSLSRSNLQLCRRVTPYPHGLLH